MLDPMPPVCRVFTMALKLEKQLKGSIVYHNEIAHTNATLIENQNHEIITVVILDSWVTIKKI